MPDWACRYIGSVVRSRPSKTTFPASGVSIPIVIRNEVVFPARCVRGDRRSRPPRPRIRRRRRRGGAVAFLQVADVEKWHALIVSDPVVHVAGATLGYNLGMIRRTIAILEGGAGSGPAWRSSILLVLALAMVGPWMRPASRGDHLRAGRGPADERPRGRHHPLRGRILHYGTYDVRVVRPGFEPFVGARRADAPAWDLPGPDLVAELVPAEFESRNRWHVDLVVEDMSTDAVLQRALVRGTTSRPSSEPSP